MVIGNHPGNPMRSRLLCLLPLLLMPSLALAFSSTPSGNTTTYSGFTAGSGNIGRYAVSTASDGTVLVNSGGRLNVPGGGSIPINVTGSISRPSAAAAVGRFLLKGSGVIGVLGLGVAAYDLAKELGYTLDNSSGSTSVVVADPNAIPSSGTYWKTQSGTIMYAWSTEQLCRNWASANGYVYVGSGSGVVGGACQATLNGNARGVTYTAHTPQPFSCPAGQYPGPTSCAVSPPSNPSTVQALADSIAAKSGWPANSKLGATVRDAIASGDALAVESPVVTGPATAPVSTTTTVDPVTGNTTTTVVTISNTYSGPTVTTTTTQTTTITNPQGAPIGDPTVTTTAQPVTPTVTGPEETPSLTLPCGIAGLPPCNVKVDEQGTPNELAEDRFKPMLDEGKQAQEDLLEQVKGDADKSFFDGFADLFVTPPLAECVPLEIPGDRGSIDPCGTVGGARAIMAYIWALSGLALCLHMVRSAI